MNTKQGKSTHINTNTFLNTIKSVSGIIFPLITFPYITNVLLVDNVGRINFGLSVVSYFSLLASLGISTYAVRECAKVKDNRKVLDNLSSEIFSINIITTIISYAFLFLLLGLSEVFEAYRVLIVIQSLTIAMTTLGTEWINTAMEDFKFITVRTLAFQILSIVLMFVFVHEPSDYLKYAVITVVSAGGANLVNVSYRKKYCKIRFTTRIDLKKHLPPILLLFSMQLAQIIYVNSDITLLGLMKGDYEVGLYSVSVKIYTIIQTLMNSVVLVVLPKLSYWYARKNYNEINKLLRYAFDFIVVLGLPCVVGVNVVGEGIVLLLSGPEYLGCIPSLRILMLALTASFFAGFINNMIMIPSGRDKICLFSSVISAVVNLVLNIILIPKYGLNAAAFTTFVSQLLGLIIKLPFVEREVHIGNVPGRLFGPVCGCVVMGIVAIAIAGMMELSHLRTCIQIVACVIVYAITLIMCKNELVLNILEQLKSKLKRQ